MINRIAECVTEHFISTGSGMSIKEIAQAMEISDSSVRRIMAKANHFIPGVMGHYNTRPRYSTNYKSMIVGVSKVEIFEPTADHLRKIIKIHRGF